MSTAIILGENYNGYNECKNKDGIQLKDLINQKILFGNEYIELK